jgi:surface protein
MKSMFYNCTSLESVEINEWKTSNVQNMEYMFQKCNNLKNINLLFDTSNVIYMNGMFAECHSLTSIDLSHLDTSNVIDVHCLFWQCNDLSLINLTKVNLTNTKDYFQMFDGLSENGTIIYNPKLIRQEIQDLFPENWNKTEIDE